MKICDQQIGKFFVQQKIMKHIQSNYKLTRKQYMYTKLTINTKDK